MKSYAPFIAAAIAFPCFGQGAPITDSQANRLMGQEMYGLVIRVIDGVEEDVKVSSTCAKMDALCIHALDVAKKLQWATVHLYDSIVFLKVAVPRGVVEKGDIIKLRDSTQRDGVPQFLEMGAKARDRKAGVCDWTDGQPMSLKGGVSCNGWSYKTISGSGQ